MKQQQRGIGLCSFHGWRPLSICLSPVGPEVVAATLNHPGTVSLTSQVKCILSLPYSVSNRQRLGLSQELQGAAVALEEGLLEMAPEHHIYIDLILGDRIRVGSHSTEVETETLDGTLTPPTGFLQDARFFLLPQFLMDPVIHLTRFYIWGHCRTAWKERHWMSVPPPPARVMCRWNQGAPSLSGMPTHSAEMKIMWP